MKKKTPIGLFLILISILMFGFFKNNKTILVEFIEQGTQAPFAKSEVPIEQLPSTFEIDTNLDIGDDKWTVVSASPQKKEDFSKSGRLKVYLTKVQYINPREVLFSLPTISNEIGQLEQAKSLDNFLVIKEDDWRQVEFLAENLTHLINEELVDISKIYKAHRASVGFNKLHLRSKVPTPLSGKRIPLAAVKAALGAKTEYAGLAFSSTAARVVGGFAFESRLGMDVWGQTDDQGMIICLCFSHPRTPVDVQKFKTAVGSLIDKNGLLFVDWVAMFVANSTDSDFEKYLK